MHRLVALAFIPNIGGMPYVCHKDGNPENNDVGNLYWGSQKDNMLDARTHNTIPRGEARYNARMTNNEAAIIKSLLAYGWKPTLIGKVCGVSRVVVREIEKWKNWREIACN